MDKTIDMAREAGFIVGEPWREMLIKRFDALVRADEREACAMVAEWEPCMTNTPQRIAAAIRARGETK